MTTEHDTDTAVDTAPPPDDTYRVTIDRVACDGVFACLVRDDRFIEAADGLAGFDPADATEPIEHTTETIEATFADDRMAEARKAAAACPLDAITVEKRSGETQ